MSSTVKSLPLPNGAKMPIIGLGTWQSPHEEVKLAVEAAIEIGYRHIDTAYVYGNEVPIGEGLQNALKSGKVRREDLFIVTKLPGVGMRKDLVKPYLEKSLQNLKLDYVDLYLIHAPMGAKFIDFTNNFPKDAQGNFMYDPDTNHVEIWKGMEEMVDAGLAKSIGLSNFNGKQIERIIQNARIKPVNLQIELHAYFQQKELIDLCRKHSMTVTAFSPIGAPALSEFEKKFGKNRTESLPKLIEDPVVTEIAKKHGKTNAQILLRFLVQKDIIVIPKSVNPGRIKENFLLFDFALDNDEVKKLEGLNKNLRLNYLNMAADTHLHPEYPFEKPPGV